MGQNFQTDKLRKIGKLQIDLILRRKAELEKSQADAIRDKVDNGK